jgi:hypothetical protein
LKVEQLENALSERRTVPLLEQQFRSWFKTQKIAVSQIDLYLYIFVTVSMCGGQKSW